MAYKEWGRIWNRWEWQAHNTSIGPLKRNKGVVLHSKLQTSNKQTSAKYSWFRKPRILDCYSQTEILPGCAINTRNVVHFALICIRNETVRSSATVVSVRNYQLLTQMIISNDGKIYPSNKNLNDNFRLIIPYLLIVLVDILTIFQFCLAVRVFALMSEDNSFVFFCFESVFYYKNGF